LISRQLKVIILVNIIIAALFFYFNYGNWTLLNDENVGLPISSEWGPIWIHVSPRTSLIPREPNQPPNFTSVIFPNYPLMLFLLSTIMNLYFIIKLQKSKEPKTAQSSNLKMVGTVLIILGLIFLAGGTFIWYHLLGYEGRLGMALFNQYRDYILPIFLAGTSFLAIGIALHSKTKQATALTQRHQG
jgi:hypothetical protein